MSEPAIFAMCALWGGMAWIRCFHLQHQINKLEKRLNGRADGSQGNRKTAQIRSKP